MDEKNFKAITKKLAEAGLVSKNQIADIYKETDEILSMIIAPIKTLRARPQSKIVNPKS
ncbi:MAG: hypothetical protein HOP27_14550 [Anaerolineales bacterium]|nr:hypothetical protein [Anaerolineales bacterium]